MRIPQPPSRPVGIASILAHTTAAGRGRLHLPSARSIAQIGLGGREVADRAALTHKEREYGCPLGETSAGTRKPKVVALSLEGISLTLTSEQVETVLADVAARAEHGEPLSLVMSASELLASPLPDDRTVSRSLLYGLMIWSCLPADGSERRTRDIAQELHLPDATAHRYIHTLRLIGLIEQNPQTRKYHRGNKSTRDPQSDK